MMINSTAVTEITAEYGQPILITFRGSGKTYSYQYNSTFVSQLQDKISKGESVGRFVNMALRNDTLVPVRA
jgi:hypothetical protein